MLAEFFPKNLSLPERELLAMTFREGCGQLSDVFSVRLQNCYLDFAQRLAGLPEPWARQLCHDFIEEEQDHE